MRRIAVELQARRGTDRWSPRAFTLIELLVVVAIIALLISILLPSLNAARAGAKATKCAANLNSVGKAVHGYLAENRGIFPASYLYPFDASGNWSITDQDPAHPFGYIHWSYFLYDGGKVDDKAFQCPEFDNGGTPRNNPGPDASDWEPGQSDQYGRTAPNDLADRQARRLAYTANAAVMPRNKFTTLLAGGPRVNKFVRDNEIDNAGRVILATELNRNWKASCAQEAGISNLQSKSHRPVNPFFHSSTGYDEYASLQQGFRYGPMDDPTYGLTGRSILDDDDVRGLISGAQGTELNAVGRHHPGGDKYGGTANFLYCDGHVARKTVWQTMNDREWGDRYYSVTGDNKVVDRFGRTFQP